AGKKYRLREFLDLLEHSTADRPAPYPCKLDLRRPEFAALVADVSPRPALTYPDRTPSKPLRRFFDYLDELEIFIGGPGGEFPYLHYDYLGFYAFINQIYGQKEFVIYPPGQEELLYIDEDHPWKSRVDNVFKPNLEQFPLFAQAKPVVEVLSP